MINIYQDFYLHKKIIPKKKVKREREKKNKKYHPSNQEKFGVGGWAFLARVHVSKDNSLRCLRPSVAGSQPPRRQVSWLQGERSHRLHQPGAAGYVPERCAQEEWRNPSFTPAKDPGTGR